MNKQELIEKIEKEKSPFNAWEDLVRNRAFEDALTIVRKIDEPKKPVVPQFVADFYELIKDDFEYGVYELCVNFYNCGLSGKIKHWFDCNDTNPIQVLVNMHQFGYEVEKEKLYRVELPNPNGDSNRYGLCKVDGRIIIGSFVFGLNKAFNTKLTEAEIKEDFDWAWPFAEVVE
ncbi:MAG: DUF1642 domain-containing protein [Streptococcus lutetiensis]|nr:DUF1642 domain-containing protein [Streptococcus lutetiensis]MBD8955604.1 DUF1642 domain-containing protein [Streptococcus lutetiensis]MBD8955893.1 DUF1642 domain-containing protein [Streptococcus lutetiensis]